MHVCAYEYMHVCICIVYTKGTYYNKINTVYNYCNVKTYILLNLFIIFKGSSGKRHWDSGQQLNIPSYATAVSIVFCITKGWLHSTCSKNSLIALGLEMYVLMFSVAHSLVGVCVIGRTHQFKKSLNVGLVAVRVTQWQECAGLSCTLNWYTILNWIWWRSFWIVERFPRKNNCTWTYVTPDSQPLTGFQAGRPASKPVRQISV